eukprot:GEMP01067935.1.p1 GENE.GEMP01067935.1~~GEMP01067935.1.p1  ORF type:complete len:168 (+),score=34.05 GEMP01067935.1:173-676(+)
MNMEMISLLDLYIRNFELGSGLRAGSQSATYTIVLIRRRPELSWTIQRCGREIQQLHKALKREIRHVPKYPGRGFCCQRGELFSEQRRMDMEDFLLSVLRITEFTRPNSAVRDFFEFPWIANPPTELSDVVEIDSDSLEEHSSIADDSVLSTTASYASESDLLVVRL